MPIGADKGYPSLGRGKSWRIGIIGGFRYACPRRKAGKLYQNGIYSLLFGRARLIQFAELWPV